MAESFDRKFFEKIIAFKAFADPVYLTALSDHIVPEYFDDGDIRNIIMKIKEFHDKTNKTPNTTELRTMFKNEEEAKILTPFFQFVGERAKDVFDIDELFRKTETFLRERAVYQAVLKTTEEASKGVIDSNKILEVFTEACNISLVDDYGFDYLERIDQHIENIKKPNKVISTGWQWVDKKLGGGLQSEGRALYTFVGGTNVGKSIFLGNLAINILKQNKTVLLISLEMPEEMYAKRISANISSIPVSMLTTQLDELKSKIIDFKKTNCSTGKLIIKEFPTKGVTVNHINSYINKLIKKGIKPDVLIVDYVNLIKGSKKYNGTYDEVKDVAERLRATTYIFKIPCVTASQLNRKGQGAENPSMDTISESIGLPYTVDAQFAIWCTEEERVGHLINLGMQKNRFGENFGQTTFLINFDTLTLTEKIDTNIMTDKTISGINDTLVGVTETLKKFEN